MDKIKVVKEILYGVAVGDALGFHVQFKPRSSRKILPVIAMGKLQDKAGKISRCSDRLLGLWSDDTSLTLCLAESLLKGFELKDQAERFVAWQDTGYLSAQDVAFDQGYTTVNSLNKISHILKNKDYALLETRGNITDDDTNGNGSLMRILPLILHIYGMEIKEQFKIVWRASAITHPHIRAAIACIFYLKWAEYIISGMDAVKALHKTQTEIKTLMAEIECPVQEHKVFSRVLSHNIAALPEDEISSDGYVMDSLEASVWCIMNTDSYRSATLKAVNLGDDTDTTAAITGGIAALIYGFDAIPADWIAALKKPEIFTTMIDKYTMRP
jgi:ADP-ribosyl-[dinitrogen reductase] hydrolase